MLLIIFMAVLPSMRKSIAFKLPRPGTHSAAGQPESDQIVLEVHANQHYAINTREVTRTDNLYKESYQVHYDPRPEKIIFVKGDSTVKYAEITESDGHLARCDRRTLGHPVFRRRTHRDYRLERGPRRSRTRQTSTGRSFIRLPARVSFPVWHEPFEGH